MGCPLGCGGAAVADLGCCTEGCRMRHWALQGACIRGEMHCEGDGFGGLQGYTLGGWSNREQDKALWGHRWQLGGCGDPTRRGLCNGGAWVMCHPPHPLPRGVSAAAACLKPTLSCSMEISRWGFSWGRGVQWVLPFPSASPDGCCTPGRGWGIPGTTKAARAPFLGSIYS